jgi:hypothetical protein
MFTQLCNFANIAAVLHTLTTMGTPNTFRACTLLSIITEPSTPSDIDISSSIGSSPSPLLFHINLQDEDKKKSSPIAIPVLPPIDDLFKQNDKQIICKTIPFTKLLCPMEEIWAECAAQEAAEADGMKPPIIISNGIQIQLYTIDNWSLSPHLTKWDSPSAKKFMPADIMHMALTMPHLEEDSEDEVSNTLDQWPSPSSMPPVGDDMHLPTKQFSGAHLGEDWEYNRISFYKYFQFLIPDPSIPCHQIVSP